LASDDKHLDAWRDSRMVSYLFLHAYRLALSPLRVHPFTRFIPRGGRVAEYGCGAAPIVTALARHYRHLDLQLVGADIPHLLFHYARSAGTGLDTAAALRDRVPALELILRRFDIVQGRVTTDGVHVDATVARKR